MSDIWVDQSPDNQDETFVFTQSIPASIWTINHNLERFPCVTVVDSSGSKVLGDVRYLSLTRIVVTFSGAFAGVAYLN